MYSQNELEKLVKDVFLADVESGEIDFPSLIAEGLAVADLTDVDLVVKTISQTTANYVKEFNAPSVTGFTKLNEYCRFEVMGNELKVILCARYKNDDTENSKNFSLGAFNITGISSEVGDKVFDMGGYKLSEAGSGSLTDAVIRVIPTAITVYGQNNYIQATCMYHYGGGGVRFEHYSSTSVGANGILTITFEASLTLL